MTSHFKKLRPGLLPGLQSSGRLVNIPRVGRLSGTRRDVHLPRHGSRRFQAVAEDAPASGIAGGQGPNTTLLDPDSEDGAAAVPSHWTQHLAHLRPGERRALRRYFPLVHRTNALEPRMQSLSDTELAGLTPAFKARLEAGETLEDLMPEAFAAVREASSRVLGLRHFDVQIIGGAVLADGQVAEMRTGEGKTLVAILPAYLYALTGKGVHVVTVNDYLAQRDAEWVGKVLQFMGLQVGVVTGGTPGPLRMAQFEADVTYITAYELAFTFLYDNMSSARGVAIRRPLHFAVVDEVDSILIDEARNPFIISVPDASMDAAGTWRCAVQVARRLKGPKDRIDTLTIDASEAAERIGLDFSADFRLKTARMTQGGMGRAIRILADMGQVIVAQPLKAPGEKDDAQEDQPDHAALRAVLLSPTEDGRLSLDVRLAFEDELSSNNSALTGTSSSAGAPQTFVTVDGMEDVPDALRTLRLVALPPSQVTEAQWLAAAPAVLWAGGGRSWGQFILQAIKAVHLYYKDIDYIIRDGQVTIIDPATGRERERSRWQQGIHQALEAKESDAHPEVTVRPQDFDQGRVTYQSLFQQYGVLSGMTGTAATEAQEFAEAYALPVVRVPPHRPLRRVDHPPAIFGGSVGWVEELCSVVVESVAVGRPVLLGTASVEESEEVVALLRGLPFRCDLDSETVLRLQRCLDALPPSLPQPSPPEDTSTLTQAQRSALQLYDELQVKYVACRSTLQQLILRRSMPSHLAASVEGVVVTLGYLTSGIELLEAMEEVMALQLLSTLRKVLLDSQLGNRMPINLLNARPEQARKEAEIIAQAGLPGAITVATAMAGRGTDILLGGNPKGLTLIALKHFLMPILAPDASDLEDWQLPPPLHGQEDGFPDEEEMLRAYPALGHAFLRAKKVAGELTQRSKEKTGAVSSAYDAAAFLSTLVEAVESDRSHFLLETQRAGHVATLEGALEWTMQQATSGTEDQKANGTTSAAWAELSDGERALRQYALLQWLWFDAKCEVLGARVRSQGGLVVVITSIPETRRSELQLRGRAGRQGDAGETFLVSSLGDPAIRALLPPSSFVSLSQFLESSGTETERIPSPMDTALIRNLTRTAEQLGYSARESTRRYDAVLDPYRRHVYRLRRTLSGVGDAARAGFMHRHLRDLAEDLVRLHVDPAQPPHRWPMADLLSSIESLLSAEGSSAATASLAIPPAPGTAALRQSGPKDELLSLVVNLGGEATGSALAEALAQNRPLPPAALPIPCAAPLPVARRAAWQAARREAEEKLRSDRRPTGPHAPQIARLYLWIGDLLAWLYEHKRATIQADLSARLPATNRLQADGALRNWERDTALECLDALWSDFLQDSTILQRAAQSRAFSMLDPVDEYRLESSAAFARLLTDFRRQWAVAMMGPVDLEKLGGAALQEGQRERRGTGSRLRASLGEVEWAVEWVKGLEGREAARERAAAAAQRAAAPADGNGGAARGNGFEQLSHGSNELDASEDALMNLLLGKLAYGLPATSPEKLEEALAEANRRAQQRARERRANTDSE